MENTASAPWAQAAGVSLQTAPASRTAWAFSRVRV